MKARALPPLPASAAWSAICLLTRPHRPGLIYCAAMIPATVLPAGMTAGSPVPITATAAGTCRIGSAALQPVVYNPTLGARLPRQRWAAVVALIGLVGLLFVPVGLSVAGPPAARFGGRAVLASCAVLALVSGAVAYAVPGIRHLRATNPPSAPALETVS